MGYRFHNLSAGFATINVATHLHENISATRVNINWYAHTQKKGNRHFLKVRRDNIHVDQPRDVLMIGEMSEKRDLAQSPLGKLNLFKHPRHQLDGDRLARYLICR